MAPVGQFLLAVALTPTPVRLWSGLDLIFEAYDVRDDLLSAVRPKTLHAEFKGRSRLPSSLNVVTDAAGELPACDHRLGAVEKAGLRR